MSTVAKLCSTRSCTVRRSFAVIYPEGRCLGWCSLAVLSVREIYINAVFVVCMCFSRFTAFFKNSVLKFPPDKKAAGPRFLWEDNFNALFCKKAESAAKSVYISNSRAAIVCFAILQCE